MVALMSNNTSMGVAYVKKQGAIVFLSVCLSVKQVQAQSDVHSTELVAEGAYWQINLATRSR